MLRFDEREGRVLVACVCPFLGERAVVDDGAGPYTEAFVPSCFRDQTSKAQSRLRVWLDLAHRKDLVIGHAVRLRELSSGLYGDFAVHAGLAGDALLAAVREGELKGVSATLTPLRSRTIDGVTRRQKAHLSRVALVAQPAYPTATVIGIRKAQPGDQAGPASTLEFLLWDFENRDARLRALQMQYMDEALELRAERRRPGEAGPSYTTDPRLQTVTRLRRELAEQRASLQAAIEPRPAPDQAPRPPVLHRDFGRILAVR